MKAIKNLGRAEEEKVFKIRYTCNILPSVEEEDQYGTIINALATTNELQALLVESVQSLIDYKWTSFAKKQ